MSTMTSRNVLEMIDTASTKPLGISYGNILRQIGSRHVDLETSAKALAVRVDAITPSTDQNTLRKLAGDLNDFSISLTDRGAHPDDISSLQDAYMIVFSMIET